MRLLPRRGKRQFRYASFLASFVQRPSSDKNTAFSGGIFLTVSGRFFSSSPYILIDFLSCFFGRCSTWNIYSSRCPFLFMFHVEHTLFPLLIFAPRGTLCAENICREIPLLAGGEARRGICGQNEDVFANALGAAFVNKRSRTSLKVRDEISENDPATNRKTGLASECYEQDIYIGW